MKQLSVLAVACVAAASFVVLVSAHAEPMAHGNGTTCTVARQ